MAPQYSIVELADVRSRREYAPRAAILELDFDRRNTRNKPRWRSRLLQDDCRSLAQSCRCKYSPHSTEYYSIFRNEGYGKPEAQGLGASHEESRVRNDTHGHGDDSTGGMRLRYRENRNHLSGALRVARSLRRDSARARRAHGAAYATYVASWRRRFRVTHGKTKIRCFKDGTAGTRRSFCSRCGTPLIYERDRSPHTVNIPRALFKARTGREARYHMGIEETPEWAYSGEPLVALDGFPGVVWNRSRRRPARSSARVF
jgi:hypothetical protein